MNKSSNRDNEVMPAPSKHGAPLGGNVPEKSAKSALLSMEQMQVVDKRVYEMEVHKNRAIKELANRHARKSAVMSGLFYVFFMFCYFFVVLEQTQVWNSYKLEYALKNYLSTAGTTTFDEVTSIDEAWDWLENGLLMALFPKPQWYNGQAWTADESNYIMQYNKLVGTFDIIQQRVEVNHSTCPSLKRFSAFYPTCWPALSSGAIDKDPFGPSSDPSKYQYISNTVGGHSVTIPLDRTRAWYTFKEMKADLFQDKSTRSLRVDFVLYNGIYRLFTSVSMVINIEPTGLYTKTFDMDTFRIQLYDSDEDKARLAFEILCVILLALTLASEVADIAMAFTRDRRTRALQREKTILQRQISAGGESAKEAQAALDLLEEGARQMLGVARSSKSALVKHFSNFWNIIDIVRLIMFFVCIGAYAEILQSATVDDLVLPISSKSAEVGLKQLGKDWTTFKMLNAINVVLCMLTMFKYMNKSPTYGMLVRTITTAAPALLKFLFMFALCFSCFMVMGMLLFGAALQEWSSVWDAYQTLMMMMTVEYGYSNLIPVDKWAAAAYYYSFLLIVFLLILNILLAILMDAYVALQDSMREQAELTALRANFNVLMEVALSIQKHLARVTNGKIPYPAHVSVGEMHTALTTTPGLWDSARLVCEEPTIDKPNPEPEPVIDFETLRDYLGYETARLIMISLGYPAGHGDDYEGSHASSEDSDGEAAETMLFATKPPRSNSHKGGRAARQPGLSDGVVQRTFSNLAYEDGGPSPAQHVAVEKKYSGSIRGTKGAEDDDISEASLTIAATPPGLMPGGKAASPDEILGGRGDRSAEVAALRAELNSMREQMGELTGLLKASLAAKGGDGSNRGGSQASTSQS